MPSTRSLIHADATFELLYATALVALGATSAGAPVNDWWVIAGGISFLAAGTSQFAYFVRSPRRIALLLAWGNIAMGTAGIGWLLVDRGFSEGGALTVAIGAAWKLACGAAQLRTLLGVRPHSA